MTRADQDRVGDILQGINRLLGIRDSGRAAFDTDWMVRSAACYELVVMGEALNSLSDDFVAEYAGLPVRDAKALRNVLAHEYFSADDDILWDTICADIPNLAAILEKPRPRR